MPPVPPGKPLVAFIPGRTGVIQGSFIGGKPRVLMPAAPPAPATVQRKIATIPTAGATTRGPGLTSPRIPPTLPATGRGSLVQASTDNSFRLPDTVVLRPPGVGQRLPDGVRSQMEAVFHADFSDVRVLVGHEAPSIGALAFTHGTDLYFAPGRYAPETPQGRLLLGHELTHVVQQARGGPRTRSGVGSPWSRTGRWRMRRIAWPCARLRRWRPCRPSSGRCARRRLPSHGRAHPSLSRNPSCRARSGPPRTRARVARNPKRRPSRGDSSATLLNSCS